MGIPAEDETIFVNVFFSPEEIQQVDAWSEDDRKWRHAEKPVKRAEAIRQLIAIGLNEWGHMMAAADAWRREEAESEARP